MKSKPTDNLHELNFEPSSMRPRGRDDRVEFASEAKGADDGDGAQE